MIANKTDYRSTQAKKAPEGLKTCSILAGIPVPLVDLATGMGHPHNWMPFQSILAGK